MEEKKFIKLLKGKENKDNKQTLTIVKQFIDESRKLELFKKKTILNFMNFKTNRRKSTEQILNDNFSLILDKMHEQNLTEFSQIFMVKYEFIKNANNFLELYNKLEQKVERWLENEDIGNVVVSDLYASRTLFERYSGEFFKNKQFLKENGKQLIDTAKIPLLFDIIAEAKGIDPSLDKYMNEKLNEQKREFAKWLLEGDLNSYFGRRMDEYVMLADEYCDTMVMILEELVDDENKDLIDIKKIKNGGYSAVFEIGSKILKIGQKRETYEIPYHNRILQPLLRKNFELNNEEETNSICVEICNKVKIPTIPNYQKVYEIYKELRDDGIVWGDPRENNIGILEQDNVAILNGERIEVDSKSIGFFNEEDKMIRKKGEYVIIDTDWLWKEDDPNKTWARGAYEYEWRYQKELKEKEIQREKIKYFHDQKSDEYFKEKNEDEIER